LEAQRRYSAGECRAYTIRQSNPPVGARHEADHRHRQAFQARRGS
jgi:hypothetical protein